MILLLLFPFVIADELEDKQNLMRNVDGRLKIVMDEIIQLAFRNELSPADVTVVTQDPELSEALLFSLNTRAEAEQLSAELQELRDLLNKQKEEVEPKKEPGFIVGLIGDTGYDYLKDGLKWLLGLVLTALLTLYGKKKMIDEPKEEKRKDKENRKQKINDNQREEIKLFKQKKESMDELRTFINTLMNNDNLQDDIANLWNAKTKEDIHNFYNHLNILTEINKHLVKELGDDIKFEHHDLEDIKAFHNIETWDKTIDLNAKFAEVDGKIDGSCAVKTKIQEILTDLEKKSKEEKLLALNYINFLKEYIDLLEKLRTLIQTQETDYVVTIREHVLFAENQLKTHGHVKIDAVFNALKGSLILLRGLERTFYYENTDTDKENKELWIYKKIAENALAKRKVRGIVDPILNEITELKEKFREQDQRENYKKELYLRRLKVFVDTVEKYDPILNEQNILNLQNYFIYFLNECKNEGYDNPSLEDAKLPDRTNVLNGKNFIVGKFAYHIRKVTGDHLSISYMTLGLERNLDESFDLDIPHDHLFDQLLQENTKRGADVIKSSESMLYVESIDALKLKSLIWDCPAQDNKTTYFLEGHFDNDTSIAFSGDTAPSTTSFTFSPSDIEGIKTIYESANSGKLLVDIRIRVDGKDLFERKGVFTIIIGKEAKDNEENKNKIIKEFIIWWNDFYPKRPFDLGVFEDALKNMILHKVYLDEINDEHRANVLIGKIIPFTVKDRYNIDRNFAYKITKVTKDHIYFCHRSLCNMKDITGQKELTLAHDNFVEILNTITLKRLRNVIKVDSKIKIEPNTDGTYEINCERSWNELKKYELNTACPEADDNTWAEVKVEFEDQNGTKTYGGPITGKASSTPLPVFEKKFIRYMTDKKIIKITHILHQIINHQTHQVLFESKNLILASKKKKEEPKPKPGDPRYLIAPSDQFNYYKDNPDKREDKILKPDTTYRQGDPHSFAFKTLIDNHDKKYRYKLLYVITRDISEIKNGDVKKIIEDLKRDEPWEIHVKHSRLKDFVAMLTGNRFVNKLHTPGLPGSVGKDYFVKLHIPQKTVEGDYFLAGLIYMSKKPGDKRNKNFDEITKDDILDWSAYRLAIKAAKIQMTRPQIIKTEDKKKTKKKPSPKAIIHTEDVTVGNVICPECGATENVGGVMDKEDENVTYGCNNCQHSGVISLKEYEKKLKELGKSLE